MKTRTMKKEEYITPTKERPVFTAHNDYYGYLETNLYKDWSINDLCGSTFALSYADAIRMLHEYIIETKDEITDLPISKYEIMVIDGKLDKHGEPIRKTVYSISTAKAKKYLL